METEVMGPSERRICSACGALLSEDSAASTCARCLMEACFGKSEHGAPEAAPAGAFDSGLAAPGEVFGDYELREEIARGGMGVVFKARQRSLDRTVALKMMLPGWLNNKEIVSRFRVEAEAASRLMHPGIVAIHDVGECDGQQFYSMDYIEGFDLVRRVKNGPVSPEEAARWIRSIAEAIHHAHQRGILHRDLKPANILIDAQGEAHVTDFGLAKLLDEARDLTVPGRVLGTPSFMPPEQADPERGAVTVASDVYGLGAILYFLLTGKAPFEGISMDHSIKLLLTEDPVPPSRVRPGIPPDLETICLKCLSKEPQRRYASADDLADDLGAWSRREPIRARPVPFAERAWFWARRNPWLAGMSAGLVLTIMAGAALQERALRQARQARADAEGLIQFMNEDLTEQLRPLGRLRLLDNVNRTVRQYYSGQPMKQTPSDPSAGKAQFYRNNASVLREMGRLDEAQESARSAIALLEPLIRREPAEFEWAVALADAHAEMRNILANQDPAGALHHARESVRYRNRAHELNPASPDALAALASARLELGSVLRQQGETAEAAQEIGLATGLLDQLPPSATKGFEGRVQWALRSYYQGLVHFDRGENARARGSFAEYLERIRQLAREENNMADARVIYSLAVAHSHLGRALLDLDDAEGALPHFREYHRLAEDLERLDPGNVNYRQELGFSLDWLAMALEKTQGASEEITGLLSRARDCFQQLARDCPQGDVWQDHAARALTRLAVWRGLKDNEQARGLLADEVAHRWNLLLQFSHSPADHRRFIRALDWCEERGGPPRATESDRAARLRNWTAQAAAEASKKDSSTEWNWTRATLQNRLANALAAQGEFENAKRELELALPIWEQLAHAEATNAEAAAGLARTYCGINIAALRGQDRRPDAKALRAFTEWLKTKRSTAAGMDEVQRWAAALESELAKHGAHWGSDERAASEGFTRAIAALKAQLPAQPVSEP